MSEEIVEEILETESEENEPVFYKPKTLNWVAAIAGILSWIILAGFILMIIGNYINLMEGVQVSSVFELFKQAAARTWMYTNLVMPLLTGLFMFITLQGVSNGLSVLLEMDFNSRESKK
jgi:hypothetical protein